MDLYLSVIICTYVRTHRLIKCLKSIEKQTLPTDQFEVIIVSRGLSEQNASRLDEYVKSTPLVVKHIRDERPGLSMARNVGIEHAGGKILHFLDDDTVAAPGCLESCVDMFKKTEALCIGGRIFPEFITPSPPWLQKGHWSFLGTLDLGDNVCEFNYPANFPVGANVAFRHSVFRRFGVFDEDLGIHGRKTAGGEETDLCYKIHVAGEKLLYDPKCLVYHCIEADKLSKAWMRKMAYRQGKGAAMLQLKHSSPIKVLWSNLMSFSRRQKPPRNLSEGKSARSFHQRLLCLQTKMFLFAGYAVEMLKSFAG